MSKAKSKAIKDKLDYKHVGSFRGVNASYPRVKSRKDVRKYALHMNTPGATHYEYTPDKKGERAMSGKVLDGSNWRGGHTRDVTTNHKNKPHFTHITEVKKKGRTYRIQ